MRTLGLPCDDQLLSNYFQCGFPDLRLAHCAGHYYDIVTTGFALNQDKFEIVIQTIPHRNIFGPRNSYQCAI